MATMIWLFTNDFYFEDNSKQPGQLKVVFCCLCCRHNKTRGVCRYDRWHCFDDNIDNLKQLAVVFALQAEVFVLTATRNTPGQLKVVFCCLCCRLLIETTNYIVVFRKNTLTQKREQNSRFCNRFIGKGYA